MIKELYEEIKRLAGKKFIIGKIYKFETYLFPPSTRYFSRIGVEFFDSSIIEVTPASTVFSNQPKLEPVGEKIPLEFDEETKYLDSALRDDLPRAGDLWRCSRKMNVYHGTNRWANIEEISNDWFVCEGESGLTIICNTGENICIPKNMIDGENGWKLIHRT